MSKFPNSPGIRWMVFADVWMFICPLQFMGCNVGHVVLYCSHMIMTWVWSGHVIMKKNDAMSPWIPVLTTSSKTQNQNG